MRYETSYHVKASGTGTINVSVRSVSTADSNRNTITSTVFAVGAIFLAFPHVASYPDAQVWMRTFRQKY